MAKTSMIIKAQRGSKFKVREYNRCPLCGRPRAYYRKFDMCRICFRNRALKGEIPGPLGGIHPSITPFQGYKTKDGSHIIAAIGTRPQ